MDSTVIGSKGAVMTTVAHILQGKPEKAVHHIAPTARVIDAIKLLAEKRVGALLVIEGERIVGIFSERDYARKVDLMGRTSHNTLVRDIMASPVLYVSPQHDTEECMALMTENRLRHLPVLEKENLVGIISIGDLVKDIISEQQFIIQQLERYITGERV